MSLDVWLTYVISVTILSLIPGPSVILVVGRSLSKGLGNALFCVLGSILGGISMMAVAYMGLGTVLATSSEFYFALKWTGVGYLTWLGLSQIVAGYRLVEADLPMPPKKSWRSSSVGVGFLVGILNPKAILFNVAFLAQFLTPEFPMTPQFLILLATSAAIVLVVLGGYGILAAKARQVFLSRYARKRMGYVGGSGLLACSALMAYKQ